MLETLPKTLSRRPNFRFRWPTTFLPWALLIAGALIACGIVSGKPSTSAPGSVENLSEFWEACEDREDAIDEWAEKEEISVTEDFADGKITFLRAGIEYERIEEEADALRDELRDNCEAKVNEAKAKRDISIREESNTTPREERAPTWTPEPTWTPGPSPTPTKTPTPTPTPTLLEQARTNGAKCISGGRTGDGDRREVLADESGSAYVKAGLYKDPAGRERVSGGTTGVPPETPNHFRYWRYGQETGSSNFACKEISFMEYPAPVLKAPKGRARVQEVADLADESCRNWVRIWREGETFLNTEKRTAKRGGWPTRFQLRIEETRPVNERFALVLVHHRHQYQTHARPIGGRATWSGWSTGRIYMVYDVTDNKCRETEYAANAWDFLPEVAPELNPSGNRETTAQRATPENTATSENTPTAGGDSPLTAEFLGVPSSHNGSDEFTFELRFSEEFSISYLTLRDDAFTVIEGTVTRARRLDKDSNTPNIRWEIAVQPSGNREVTIRLPATADCNAQGAICTEDGRTLTNGTEISVAGR